MKSDRPAPHWTFLYRTGQHLTEQEKINDEIWQGFLEKIPAPYHTGHYVTPLNSTERNLTG